MNEPSETDVQTFRSEMMVRSESFGPAGVALCDSWLAIKTRLAVLDGTACAEEQANGDGPCGVCVKCLVDQMEIIGQSRKRHSQANIQHQIEVEELTEQLEEARRIFEVLSSTGPMIPIQEAGAILAWLTQNGEAEA